MAQRINAYAMGNKTVNALHGVGQSVTNSSLDRSLLELLYFRVSQINGCAYCLDMHSKDLRAKGETEQRLYMLDAWRETPLYTNRERAALAWAEAVTKLEKNNVPDDVYEEVLRQFSEEELVDLTMAVIGINSFTRINIAFRTPAGDYVPGQHATLLN